MNAIFSITMAKSDDDTYGDIVPIRPKIDRDARTCVCVITLPFSQNVDPWFVTCSWFYLVPFHQWLFNTTPLISKHVCICIPSPVPPARLPCYMRGTRYNWLSPFRPVIHTQPRVHAPVFINTCHEVRFTSQHPSHIKISTPPITSSRIPTQQTTRHCQRGRTGRESHDV
jgi:hypothetical protein